MTLAGRIPAAASSAVRATLYGQTQPASWLGVYDSALYLLTDSATVIAVVSHDAVRLPCAVVAARTSTELPLADLGPAPAARASAAVGIGNGRIRWEGRAGEIQVECRRQWAPPRAPAGTPLSTAIRTVEPILAVRDIEVEPERVSALAAAGADPQRQRTAARALLGRGPGLTPSGDDVLAGWLIAARAFGLRRDGVVHAVVHDAPQATTALSAQLLRHAARGDGLAELVDVIAFLIGRATSADALGRLIAIGHTSGTALATGVLAAATPARAATAGVGVSK